MSGLVESAIAASVAARPQTCSRKVAGSRGRSRRPAVPFASRRPAPHGDLLRSAWAEFDRAAASVSAGLRLGPRGGGRTRDEIVRHVLNVEVGDFSPRVGVKGKLADLLETDGRADHRSRYVDAMRAWLQADKPLGKWTVPYLLRHTAFHALDHAWEMQDRNPVP